MNICEAVAIEASRLPFPCLYKDMYIYMYTWSLSHTHASGHECKESTWLNRGVSPKTRLSGDLHKNLLEATLGHVGERFSQGTL